MSTQNRFKCAFPRGGTARSAKEGPMSTQNRFNYQLVKGLL